MSGAAFATGIPRPASGIDRRKILAEGRNCWRTAPAHRAAFLVDGAAYFEAFASAAEKARESILILAWDIDSRVRLHRDGRDRGLPGELGKFLDAIISRRRGLRAHILAWNFNLIYALEREPLPVVKLDAIAATAFTFGPGEGFAYSLAGSFLSAMVTYGIGRLLGGKLLRHLAGHRLDRLGRLLRRRGLVAVATVRVLPVAPFTFINLTAGALRIGVLDYTLGTVLGMSPGLLAITFFGERLSNAVRHPGIESFLGLAALLVAAAEWVRRRLEDREEARAGEAAENGTNG